jgi:hypothetical protein
MRLDILRHVGVEHEGYGLVRCDAMYSSLLDRNTVSEETASTLKVKVKDRRFPRKVFTIHQPAVWVTSHHIPAQ